MYHKGSYSSTNLFTCYSSLIDNQINNSIVLNGFADDHSIHKTNLEETVKQIKCWMDTMHLKLNSDKTEYILFRSQAQPKKISPEPLNAHGNLIEIGKVVMYLGGFLDQQLNFKQHIKEKVKKKKTMTNLIKICAIEKYLTVQTFTMLVLRLYITNLNYANTILCGLPKSTLGKYQTIQNMCQIHLNRNKYSSSSLALRELHWLPIEQRIKYKILTSTLKCITGTTYPEILTRAHQHKKNRRDNMHSNNNENHITKTESQVQNLCNKIL